MQRINLAQTGPKQAPVAQPAGGPVGHPAVAGEEPAEHEIELRAEIALEDETTAVAGL
jgi:hypothetical protein